MNLSKSLVVLCILWTGGWARWSQDISCNTPVTDGYGAARFPFAVSDGDGGAIIIWTHEYNEIRTQRIDCRGNRLWGDGGVAIADEADLWDIRAVIGDNQGGAIILWRDVRNISHSGNSGNPTQNFLYLQRIDNSGRRLWTDQGIVVRDTLGKWSFTQAEQLIPDQHGGCYIIWADSRTREWDILAQHVDCDGVSIWQENGVKLNAWGPVNLYFKVTAVADREAGLICNVLGHLLKINQSGEFVWGVNGCYQVLGLLFSDLNGGALVVTPTTVRRFTTDGIRMELATVPVTNGGAVTSGFWNSFADRQGNIFYSWWEDREGESRLFTQKMNSDSEIQWPAVGIPRGGSPLISDGTGGMIYQYSDNHGIPPFSWHVQRIDQQGNPVWGPDGVCFRTRQEYLAGGWSYRLVADGAGGVIIVWEEQDTSDLSWRIKIQSVGADGELGRWQIPD